MSCPDTDDEPAEVESGGVVPDTCGRADVICSSHIYLSWLSRLPTTGEAHERSQVSQLQCMTQLMTWLHGYID